MLAITPARINSPPAMVKTQSSLLLPLKNRMATPKIIGMSVIPKLLAPQKLQYEPTTLTWLEMRYPPTQLMIRPITNWPSPPGVPPTSLKERSAMAQSIPAFHKELKDC